jgi:hypothetical protein
LITQDHFPSVARDTGSGYERVDVRVTNILDLSSIIARVQAIGPYALATTTDLTLRRTGVLDLESLRLAAANSRPARQAYAAGVWIASFAAVVGENSGGSGVDVEVVVVAAGDGDGHHLRARGEDRAVDPNWPGRRARRPTRTRSSRTVIPLCYPIRSVTAAGGARSI